METREQIATRIHSIYVPNDKQCSFIDKDWFIAAEIEQLQAEVKKLKKRYSINSFQRELAVQCIDFVKNSPKGYGSIPLGHNLTEDIGMISQAGRALKEGE